MNLTIINQNGKLLVDSREVAQMIGKRHSDLLESIKGYIEHLTNGKFRSLDFFIEDTYLDSKGEMRPCYLLTKKGCDMVANKMTGEKGVLFTAAYVSKFEEMEKELQQPQIKASPKDSKAGGLNGLLKTLNGVMKEEKISPHKRAEVLRNVARQCGLDIPDAFVKKPAFVQVTLNIPIE